MLTWLVRIVLALSGVVAGWFVARESPNFSLVQMAASLLLITIVIAVATFLPSLLAWLRDRRDRTGL